MITSLNLFRFMHVHLFQHVRLSRRAHWSPCVHSPLRYLFSFEQPSPMFREQIPYLPSRCRHLWYWRHTSGLPCLPWALSVRLHECQWPSGVQDRLQKHTFIDVAFDHHTHDSFFTLLDLTRQLSRNLWLVLVILLRIAMRAVNHQPLSQPFLG